MDDKDHQILLTAARQSIMASLQNTKVEHPASPKHLHEPLACFVTLKIQGKLRGCIGNLQPNGPLFDSVCRNACSAAFQDPRFPPLELHELEQVTISISVLQTPTKITFDSDAHLLQQLQPDRDGLIIENHQGRATFLPAVWESIKQPEQFLAELKRKAGIEQDEAVAKAWVYQTESFSE